MLFLSFQSNQSAQTHVTPPWEQLIYSPSFWVAIATFVVAGITLFHVWYLMTGRKERYIRERIEMFYIPFIAFLSTHKTNTGLKNAWDRVRPFIRLASPELFKIVMECHLYESYPLSHFRKSNKEEGLKFKAWESAFNLSKREFVELDRKYAKIRQIEGRVDDKTISEAKLALMLI